MKTLALVVLLLTACVVERASANVYATNIKLNNGTNNLAVPQGGSATISYILNEPASAGVSVQIMSGSTPVRTISIAPNTTGALRGPNSIVWNGKDDGNSNVPAGNYSVRVTAGATGYQGWTLISSNSNPGNYVWEPRGIAVNQNSNSIYYGRVFVSNSRQGPGPLTNSGDRVGILKLNADGSSADEGIFSDGGYPWAGDFFSPWKLEVSADDKVYINDWTGNGEVISFDQTIAAASQINVLRPDNRPPVGTVSGTVPGITNYANLSGPFVTGTGAGTQIWMADISYDANTNIMRSAGVRRWNVNASGIIPTNNLGATVVLARGPSVLNLYPYDAAVDRLGRIYTIQYRSATNDSNFKVFRFPANPTGTPVLTNSDWRVGGTNQYIGSYGIAVNPAATYVAVALREGSAIAVLNNPPLSVPPALSLPTVNGGSFQFNLTGESNVQYVVEASTNLVNWTSVATNIAPTIARSFSIPAPAAQTFYRASGQLILISSGADHDHRDVAWDNVGNLYAVDNFASRWVVYSPPGTNQASTVGVPLIQVAP